MPKKRDESLPVDYTGPGWKKYEINPVEGKDALTLKRLLKRYTKAQLIGTVRSLSIQSEPEQKDSAPRNVAPLRLYESADYAAFVEDLAAGYRAKGNTKFSKQARTDAYHFEHGFDVAPPTEQQLESIARRVRRGKAAQRRLGLVK